MSESSPTETVVVNARLCVAHSVEQLMERVRSGRVSAAVRESPFSFGESKPIVVPGQALANAVAERGLHKDQAFLAAVNEALMSTADGAMFSFLTAIDGEGHWEGEPRVAFCTLNGERVTGDLHGNYFQTEIDFPNDD